MYPVLFRIGGFTVTSYGVMVLLAFITGAWLTGIQLRRRGLDATFAWDMLVWVAVGGIIGAKLYYLALHWQDVAAAPLQELTNRAGLVWYGGLIGGLIAFVWYVRRRNMPLFATADAAGPALAAAYGIGRIGCFLVGENYGFPTGSWVGVEFADGNPPSTAGNLRAVGADIPAALPDSTVMAVHPTQLYEVGLSALIFVALWKLSGRRLRPGQLFGVYLALASIERVAIEFVRAKDDRFVFGLTTSQVFAMLGIALAIALWRFAKRRGPSMPPLAGESGAGARRVPGEA